MRPYMRARLGLAQTLQSLGRDDEALNHYRELVRLNPNDNQGARYRLIVALLELDVDDDAGALLFFGDRWKETHDGEVTFRAGGRGGSSAGGRRRRQSRISPIDDRQRGDSCGARSDCSSHGTARAARGHPTLRWHEHPSATTIGALAATGATNQHTRCTGCRRSQPDESQCNAAVGGSGPSEAIHKFAE